MPPELPPPEPSLLSRVCRAVFRPSLLIVLALGASAWFLAPRLQRYLPDLSSRPEYRLHFGEIEVTEPPYWVPPDLLHQVREKAGLPEELSLLDPTLTETVAKAFARHPWIAEVVQVRKSYPPRVRVEVRYRRPVAMVRVKAGLYPVDEHGILLPPTDFSPADAQRYPLIQNITSTPRGAAGVTWGDLTVLGAARLADALGDQWKNLQLTAVLAPTPTKAKIEIDDLQYELVTTGGSRIVWGRVPGSTHPGELTAAQKIGRLQKYLSDFGSFDQPHGPYLIDITHWQEISRRPLMPTNTSGTPRSRR